MKVKDLRERLARLRDDDEIVIPIDTIGAAIGSHPTVSVTDLYAGFDWDQGMVFVQPDKPLHIAGDDYQAERKRFHNATEALGFIYMALSSKTLSTDKLKLDAIRRTMRQRGFTSETEA